MTPLRWFASGMIVAVATFVAFLSMQHAVATALLMKHDVATAARIAPREATVLAHAAENARLAGQAAEAANLATRAIAIAPFNTMAIRIKAGAQADAGNLDAYQELMRLAALGGWRDLQTQSWAFQRALTTANWTVAVARAEALIRLGQQRDRVFTAFRLMTIAPESRDALFDRLKDNPVWRSDFFLAADQGTPAQIDAMAALLSRLKRSATPPSPAEARATIGLLLNEGRMDRAWTLRNDLFGTARASALSSDPGFDLAPPLYHPGYSALAFDWTVFTGATASASVDASAGRNDGPGLVAVASGNADATLAEQSSFLLAGRYALDYWVSGDPGATGTTLRWRIYCARTKQQIAESKSAIDIDGWHRATVPFDVTAACNGVRLDLVSANVADPGTEQASFDDVAIRRVDSKPLHDAASAVRASGKLVGTPSGR